MKIAFYKGLSSNKWDAFKQIFIRAWTGFGKYSHCEIIDDAGNWYAATAYHPGYVVSRKLKPIESKWDIFELDVSDNEKERILTWLDSKLGLKYDWLGVFLTIGLGINRNNHDEYFCSELAAAALSSNVLQYESDSPITYSPNSLYTKLVNINEIPRHTLYDTVLGHIKQYVDDLYNTREIQNGNR